MPGPPRWIYRDSLAGYSQTQIMPAIAKVCKKEGDLEDVTTSVGMRKLIDDGEHHILEALHREWPGLSFDPEALVSEMEAAEVEGRVGRIAFASQLSALDCAFGDARIERMKRMGLAVEPHIHFDMQVEFQWEPVDSQRLLLWASRVGKQEIVANALWRLHFEQRSSLTKRSTLLQAGSEAGLDSAEVDAFLDSQELLTDVQHGYGVASELNIRWPPFLVLNGPYSNGGPFRDGSKHCTIIRGPPQAYAEAFEKIWRHVHEAETIWSWPRRYDDDGEWNENTEWSGGWWAAPRSREWWHNGWRESGGAWSQSSWKSPKRYRWSRNAHWQNSLKD